MVSSHLSLFLFANLITTFAYGIAFTLFLKSVHTILRKKRSTGKLNMPLVLPSILIFCFATLNIGGLWVNTYRTFVVNIQDPEAYLGLITTPAKTAFQTGQVGAIILADALMVYRTWIVWNHNYYVIVIPCLTFVATFVAGVYFVELQHRSTLYTAVFSNAITQWTVAFLLCSFATTVYSTGLIAFKLLAMEMKLRNNGISTRSTFSRRTLRILVESAALYSLNHLLYAVLYEEKSNVEATPSFLEASIASITCSMIIVRSEKAVRGPSSTTIGSEPSTAVDSEDLGTRIYSASQGGNVFSLRPLGVKVDVKTVSDGEV